MRVDEKSRETSSSLADRLNPIGQHASPSSALVEYVETVHTTSLHTLFVPLHPKPYKELMLAIMQNQRV